MNNSLVLPRLQRLRNSQSIRMRGAILQITVNNNLPPSAPLPPLKQCFIAFFFFFFSICICHPRGPLFDLSPPVSASPGSRWPVDWQLRSDIWWDEASTGAPRGQKQTSGVFSPSSSAQRSRAAASRKKNRRRRRRRRRRDPTTRWRKVQANIFSSVFYHSTQVNGKLLSLQLFGQLIRLPHDHVHAFRLEYNVLDIVSWLLVEHNTFILNEQKSELAMNVHFLLYFHS